MLAFIKRFDFQQVNTSDIKSMLTENYFPKQLFVIPVDPSRTKRRKSIDTLTRHLRSGFSKREFVLIPPRALYPVILTPYVPKATLETSTSSSVQKWALSHSSAITISTLYILGLNTSEIITVKLKKKNVVFKNLRG